MKPTLYGIPNCDTIRKARAWFKEHGIDYDFHDYKKQGIDATRIESWYRKVQWEDLLNRRGTTWRKLDEARKASIDNPAAATALMCEQPSLIRRPVIEAGETLLIGFDAERYSATFL